MMQGRNYILSPPFKGFLPVLYLVISVGIIFCCNGCIEKYYPEIDEDHDLVAIDAALVKGDSLQRVVVSRTASVDRPLFQPVSGCTVYIIDDQDNQFELVEGEDAYYVHIPEDQLIGGRNYRLWVLLPDGSNYESEFMELEPDNAIDSVYFAVEEVYDKILDRTFQGVQFYVDIKAPDTLSRYFRWKLTETWEYNSIAPITFYLTGDPEEPYGYPPDSWSYYTCWKTASIHQLFLSNTINLTVNEKKRVPLNYVRNNSLRMSVKYSLLVSQYLLSRDAYLYWEKARNETQDAGGLYTNQPGQPISNIHNTEDSAEVVLGFFWTSTVSYKRIFVTKPASLDVYDPYCRLEEYDETMHGAGPFPLYIFADNMTDRNLTASAQCFDCRLKGGTLDKPDFWE